MPGRLIMDRHNGGAHLANGDGHDSSPAAKRADSSQAVQKTVGQPLLNGDHDGTTGPDSAMAALNTLSSAVPIELNLSDADVALLKSSFRPLSILYERIPQEAWLELDATLTQMAELDVSGTNGINGNGAVNGVNADALRMSICRKRLLLEYANKHRERFIKLLVISQWAQKSAGALKRLIDINFWLGQRAREIAQVPNELIQLKNDLHWFKEPNPDMKTALEVLSKGTASWLPNLGYIPPKPTTAREMLKTIKDLNALLSIRMNLYEEPPRAFQDWTVANGKVTFRVASEFELDVTIVDEDPAAQLWFIDLRLLFTPSNSIPDGQLRDVLGNKVDQVLRESGLSGCFDILHDFCLTHKIATLRRQAFELCRGVWNDSVRVESVHRSLVVQYWTGQTSKSWIELGVASGKSKKQSWRGPEPPRIGVRWFRNGVNVQDPEFDFDWTDLSMERILHQVVARHTTYLLKSIKQGLPLAPGGAELRGVVLDSSTTEPSDCALSLQVSGQTLPVRLIVQTVTGRLMLQPPSPVAEQAEHELNKHVHPEERAPSTLARYCARQMQTHTELQAERLGWRILRGLKLEKPEAAFPQKAISSMTFFRGQRWGLSAWVIAVTYNLGGELWWAVKLADPGHGGSIQSVHPIQSHLHSRSSQPLSLSPLRDIEKLALMLISTSANIKRLEEGGVKYSLQQEPYPFDALDSAETPAPRPALETTTLYTLFVQIQHLLKSAYAEALALTTRTLRINAYPSVRNGQLVTHVVRGRLMASKDPPRKLLTNPIRDGDVHVRVNGKLTFKLVTRFGEPCIDILINRMSSIERVRSFVAALHGAHLTVTSVNLKRILFIYPPSAVDKSASSGYSDYLRAELAFPNPTPSHPETVSLSFPTDNPHYRILHLLRHSLKLAATQSYPSTLFASLVVRLRLTLPLLRALDTIESNDLGPTPRPTTPPSSLSNPTPAVPTPHVHLGVVITARTSEVYRIAYCACNLTLEVKTVRLRNQLTWSIEVVSPPPIDVSSWNTQQQQPQQKPQASAQMREALARAWRAGEKGNGWRGIGSGVTADAMGGVGEALAMLDGVVRTVSLAELGGGGGGGPGQDGEHEIIVLD